MEATTTKLLERTKDNSQLDIRVSMPVEVISYDISTNTVEVEVMAVMTTNDDQNMPYPPIVDCPCKFTRGGGFHVTHPYKAGDTGMVVFSDRCIDAWFESGRAMPSMDFRVHSMSDAYFVGAVANLTNLPPVFSDAMFVGKDDNSVGVKIGDGLDFYGKATFHDDVVMSKKLTVTDVFSALKQILLKGADLVKHKHSGVTRGNSETDEMG